MSDTFQIQGRIVHIGETQTVGTNGFRKREFILNTAEIGAKYPNEIAFELHKDQCDIHLSMGPATVRFAIQGRAWKDRHFNTLKAFSVATINDANDAKPIPEYKTPEPEQNQTGDMQTGAEDDLPF